MDVSPLIICTLSCQWAQPYWQTSMYSKHCSHSACHRHSARQGMGRTLTLPPKRPHKSVIVSRSPCVSQVPMATNGGAHTFNKNDNNWLHKHFEPQQVDVVVSSTSILGLECLSAFPRIHPLNKLFSWSELRITEGHFRLILTYSTTSVSFYVGLDHKLILWVRMQQ